MMKYFLTCLVMFGFLLVIGEEPQEYGRFPATGTGYFYDLEWQIERFENLDELLDRLTTSAPAFLIGVWDEKTLEKIEVERHVEIEIKYRVKKVD